MTRDHDRSDDTHHQHQSHADAGHQRQQRRGKQHRSSAQSPRDQQVTHDPNQSGHVPYAPRSSHEQVQPGERQVGQTPGGPADQQRQTQYEHAHEHGGRGGDAHAMGGHPGSAGRHQQREQTGLQRGAEQQHRGTQPSHHGPSPQQSHRTQGSQSHGGQSRQNHSQHGQTHPGQPHHGRQSQGHQQGAAGRDDYEYEAHRRHGTPNTDPDRPSELVSGGLSEGHHGPRHQGGGDRERDSQSDFPRSRQQAYDPRGGTQHADLGHGRGRSGDADRRTGQGQSQGNIPRGNERHHDQHPEHLVEEGLMHGGLGSQGVDDRREGDRRNQRGP